MRWLGLTAAAAVVLTAWPARTETADKLQGTFETIASGQFPIVSRGVAIPGAVSSLKLSRAGACRSNVTLSTTAYSVNGKSVAAAGRSAQIDWSKVRTAVHYDGTGLALASGMGTINLPLARSPEYEAAASDLLVACGGLSAANTVLPAGAPPRWEQVRDPATRGRVACTYAKIPDLRIVQRYRHATWEQRFGRKGGNEQTELSLLFSPSAPKLVSHALTLLAPTPAGFSASADRVEWVVDGKLLWTARACCSENIAVLTGEKEWGPVPDALATASLLVARLLAADGTVLMEQKFDVSTVRHARTALASTDYNCVLG